MPWLVIVAGPNGSGKTTLVHAGVVSAVLPAPVTSINADDIARALAGGARPTPEQSLHAARRADALLDAEIEAGRSVIVETVLSSDKLRRRVAAAPTGSRPPVAVLPRRARPRRDRGRSPATGPLLSQSGKNGAGTDA